MKPGRELDALIAEKVMGLEVVYTTPPQDKETYSYVFLFKEWAIKTPDNSFCSVQSLPAYSTDMVAAWSVVEKLNNHHLTMTRVWEWVNDGNNPEPEETRVFNSYTVPKYTVTPGVVLMIHKKTYTSYTSMAHAICLAALGITTGNHY